MLSDFIVEVSRPKATQLKASTSLATSKFIPSLRLNADMRTTNATVLEKGRRVRPDTYQHDIVVLDSLSQCMTWVDLVEAQLYADSWLSIDIEQTTLDWRSKKDFQSLYLCEYTQETDIHRERAAEMFGVRYEDVTDEQRRAAKARYFGRDYGIHYGYPFK
jgi:hypothetical protein